MRHESRIALIVTLLIAVAALVWTQSSLSGVSAQASDLVTLSPVKDNTIYSESGNLSSGVGQHLFAGKIGGRGGNAVRRALLAFDIVGAVPVGSTITSAQLTMSVSKTVSG